MEAEAGSEDEDPQSGAAGPVRDVVYALWFLKFLCPEEGCGGTLAPPHPAAETMECNYCGRLRSDAEFYECLEDDDGAA